MQLLLKHDKTLIIHADHIQDVSLQASSLTGIPEAALLLTHNGRILSSDSLATMDNDSMIHVTHKLIGGGPKKRCQHAECSAPALRGLDCSLCAGQFCGKHRLLEQHSCAGLANCKEELRRANQAKLERERCVAPKVV